MKKVMILLEDITCKQIEAFSSAPTIASNKALLNYHTGLSSLWTGAIRKHMVHYQQFVKLHRPTMRRQSKIIQIRDAFSIECFAAMFMHVPDIFWLMLSIVTLLSIVTVGYHFSLTGS